VLVPTYSYACTSCDHRFDVQQSFSDAALTDCPECAGRLRKVFSAVGVVFKGSGFYRTDSRNGSAPTKATGSGDGAAGSGDAGGSSSGEKSGGKSGEASGGTTTGGTAGSSSSPAGSSTGKSTPSPAPAPAA
jgi:putative FmdB family regulatory protein